MPWPDYLRRDGQLQEALEQLPDLAPVAAGPFDRRRLRAAVRAFLDRGADDYLPALRQLLMIAFWHRAAWRPLAGACLLVAAAPLL